MPTFAPHRALRHRVREIVVLESSEGETSVLPSTAAVLGFQYRGRVRAGDELLSTAGVTGLQSAARRYRYEPDTATILVRFTTQGAACLGVPASELADRSLPLEALLPASRVRDASERLLSAQSLTERIEVVQHLLLELPFARDRVVARAVDLMSASAARVPSIAAVARELDLSERQLERRFLQRVGVTPKRFAKLCRFERALLLLPSAPSLGRLARDVGYYDQSHFIREFRSYAGSAPSALRLAR